MASYATLADVVQIYTQELVDKIAWDVDSSAVNAAAVTRALEEASAEIDTHISSRYPIPVHPTPPILRKLCVDIGVYNVAFGYSRRTDEMRLRYDDAIKMLIRIADGRAGLGLASPVSTADPDGGTNSGPAPGTGVMTFGSIRTRRAN